MSQTDRHIHRQTHHSKLLHCSLMKKSRKTLSKMANLFHATFKGRYGVSDVHFQCVLFFNLLFLGVDLKAA